MYDTNIHNMHITFHKNHAYGISDNVLHWIQP